ncbi:MAG: type II toxin-antitoxin system RelE/ParE family toxin [Oxalobacteraceae bacterium]|nr:MAG: type II toxin-antitoxin system RelE/ParE family toxin [Oxalobacteraceae bacterium]
MPEMYSVNILDLAVEDIVERIDYVRNRWGDDVADNAYRDLMDKLNLLETQPHMGSVPEELIKLGISTFRIIVHASHTKVLYELEAETETINIHMVYSSNQDFQALLYKRIMRA